MPSSSSGEGWPSDLEECDGSAASSGEGWSDVELDGGADGGAGDIQLPAIVVALPSARKRGRPRGTFGSRAVRARLQEERAFQEWQAAEQTHVQRASAVRMSHVRDQRRRRVVTPSTPAGHLTDLLMPVGVCGPGIIEALGQHPPEKKQHVESAKKYKCVIDHWLTSAAPRACPMNAEAESLGINQRQSSQAVEDVASCVFFASRLVWESLSLRVKGWIEEGSVKGVCLVIAVQYDETPTMLRIALDGHTTSTANGKKKVNNLVKVIQCELQVAMVLQGARTHGKPTVLHSELPCTLRTCDHATSDVIVQVLSSAWRMPSFVALRSSFLNCIDIGVCDRASANLKVERYLGTLRGQMRLSLPCEVHMMSTVQGKSYSLLDDDISAVIAFALLMKPIGATEALREALRIVLRTSVRIYNNAQPGSGTSSESMEHRRHLFDRLFSDSVQDQRRRKVLEHWLIGDLRIETVEHHGPADLNALIEGVVRALVPAPLPVFPRHRWMKSSETVRQLALLFATHNLGQRAARLWIPRLVASRSTDSHADGPHADGPQAESDMWALVAQADEEETQSWAAENAKRRVSVSEWLLTQPGPRILVMAIIISPQVSLLASLFEVAGEAWDDAQIAAAARGEPREFRLTNAYKQKATFEFFSHMAKLFQDASVWSLLDSDRSRTNLTLAHVMMCRAAGGVDLLLHRRHGNYPFKLFHILHDEGHAERVFADPPCRHCPFTAAFVQRYRTPEALASEDARSSLLAVAVLARRDTTRVECRFAAMRRIKMVRSLTYAQTLTSASTFFVLRRQRIIETGRHLGGKQRPQHRQTPQKEPAKPTVHGGGGAYRGFISEQFRGRAWTSPALVEANKEYRRIKKEDGQRYAELCKVGRAATETHRHTGQYSFGLGHAALNKSEEVALRKVYGTDPDLDPEVEPAELAIVAQCEDLQVALEDIAARARVRRQTAMSADEERLNAIIEWSSRTAPGEPGFPSVLAACARPEPLPASYRASILDVRPPAIEIAEGVASRGRDTFAHLRTEWQNMHKYLRHADVPKIPKVKNSASRCWLAGRCLCSPAGSAADTMHKSLVRVMKSMCSKRKPLNKVLKDGNLVLELSSCTNERVWAECVYFNLSSWDINFMLLSEVEESDLVRSAMALQMTMLQVQVSSATLGLERGIDLCASLSPHNSWRLKFWTIFRGPAPADLEFPMYIFVAPLTVPETWFWSGERRQERLPPAPPPLGDSGDQAPDPLDDEHGDGDEGGGSTGSEGDDSEPDNPDDGADSGGSIWQDCPASESSDGGLFQEEDVEPITDAVAMPEPAAEAAIAEPAPATPVVAPAPNPPPPPPLPAPVARAPRQRPAHGGEWVGPWWRFTFPDGLGFLVFNHNANSLDAHCPRHQACRTNRSLGDNPNRPALGRPVGQLVAWLLDAGRHETKAQHKAVLRDEIRACSYIARRDARQFATGLPGFDEVLALERHRRDGEGEEPFGLAG